MRCSNSDVQAMEAISLSNNLSPKYLRSRKYFPDFLAQFNSSVDDHPRYFPDFLAQFNSSVDDHPSLPSDYQILILFSGAR